MCETRLNEYGIRRVTESMQELSWNFVAGLPQPQRREDLPGRLFDPMPGGVGSLVKAQIPFTRTPLTVTDGSEEDLRRIQAFTKFSGEGLEPIRIVQVLGYARATQKECLKNRIFLAESFPRVQLLWIHSDGAHWIFSILSGSTRRQYLTKRSLGIGWT